VTIATAREEVPEWAPATSVLLSAAAVVAFALVTSVAAVVSLGWGLLLLAVLAWCALSGVPLARAIYRRGGVSESNAWFVGPVWGYAISMLAALAMWVAGIRQPALLLLAPVAALVAAPVASRAWKTALDATRFDRRDLLAVLILMLIVPLVVAAPFAHVAEPVEAGGRAYRAYFTADFVWAMTVVGEVAKGDVPPANPFHVDDALHYYWLSHFLSAIDYRVLHRHLDKEAVILANSIGFGVLFMAFLYGFVRQFVGSRVAAGLGCAGAFLFNSFEGLDRIVTLWQLGAPLDLIRTHNIDAVTRWFYQGQPVDGLQRMLLYQPHHLLGYAVGLSGLQLLRQARDPGRPFFALVVGACLGVCLLFSSFTAIIIGAGVALYYAIRLIGARSWLSAIPCGIAGALPVALAAWLASALQYVDGTERGFIEVGLSPVATSHGLWNLFLSFGPMLIVGAAGAFFGLANRAGRLVAVGCLAVSALVFYFFVDVPTVGGWVGWRTGHLLLMAFAALGGYAIQELWRGGRLKRVLVAAVLAVLAAAAAPTVAIDIYNAQDVTNRHFGPGFPWTLVLTRDELDAFEWLKRATSPDARVQMDVVQRAAASWAYLPAFAERRMTAGLPISMVPLPKYRDTSARIRNEVFHAASADAAWRAARALRIDYLFIGPPERRSNPQIDALLDGAPWFFRPVFRNETITIYAVARG
jgi:hypothetical protein